MSESAKQAQRRLALCRRQALPDRKRTELSRAICRHLMALPALGEARNVFSYMALPGEVDLAAFHAWAVEAGKQVAFPVSYAAGRMEAYVPGGPESWERGRYGILTPVPERSTPVAPEELDAVILPCVGFDGAGGRLGHGGGYYDRYLLRCPQALRVLVAFEVQRLDRVAAEPHDLSFHILVTEAGVWSAEGEHLTKGR